MLNTFSPESFGVIRTVELKDTICPVSGIMSNIIQQMICVQWTDEMARRGSVPYFLVGNYREGKILIPFSNRARKREDTEEKDEG